MPPPTVTLPVSGVAPNEYAVKATVEAALNAALATLYNQTALCAPIASPTFTGTVGGITKTMVGLGSVDNTSDANKPVSTAAATALALKAPLASPTFTGTVGGITKTMVGLGSVDNTSDANKPVSTAQQTALNLKLAIAAKATPEAALAGIATDQWVAPDGVAAAVAKAKRDIRQEVVNQTATAVAATAVQPGLSPWRYSNEVEGFPSVLPRMSEVKTQTSALGRVIRLSGGEQIAPVDPIPLEDGRKYRVRYKLRRFADSGDPAGDAVEFSIAWLGANMSQDGLATPTTVVESLTDLVAADGWVTGSAIIAKSALIGVTDFNAAAVYARPVIRQYGASEPPLIDVLVLTWSDVTDATITTDTAADAEARLTVLENRTPWSSALLAANYDLDTLLDPGTHYVTSPVNGPAGGASVLGVTNTYVSASIIQQQACNLSGSIARSYLRIRTAGSWSAWIAIASEGYVDAQVAALAASAAVAVEGESATGEIVTNSGSFTWTPGVSRWMTWQRTGAWCRVNGIMQFTLDTISAASRLIIPLPYAPINTIAGVAAAGQIATVAPAGNIPEVSGMLGLVGVIQNDGSMPAGLHLAYEKLSGSTGSERLFYSIAANFTTGVTYAFAFSAHYRIAV